MENIVLRHANKDDTQSIYDLLAAEGYGLSMEAIATGLGGYHVVQSGQETIAVLSEGAAARAQPIVAVHPGYPQELMSRSITGLIAAIRQREAALHAKLRYMKRYK